MKKLNKLIITELRGHTAAVLASENRIIQIRLDEINPTGQVGMICVGKVRNVIKNLNAAFVEYLPGVNGYYSLSSNRIHYYADGTVRTGTVKSGDEILVQISRSAVKTKDPVLTGALSLTGQYCVVTLGRRVLGISSKISDHRWREDFKKQWESMDTPDCEVIVRTNGYGVPISYIYEEVWLLFKRLTEILADAVYRLPMKPIFCPDSFAVRAAQEIRLSDTSEVVTDLPDIYEELSACGLFEQPHAPALRLYEDPYSLSSLYSLESALSRALSKTVWLRSGGNLVIEPTEAMTIIDVNTGKNVEKKTAAEVQFKTNLEAAREIAFQLRLRNLSGIIIIDFIDMESKEQQAELMAQFRRALALDPIKTTLVDMTRLGLVEVTRKKIHRPLHEQINSDAGFFL